MFDNPLLESDGNLNAICRLVTQRKVFPYLPSHEQESWSYDMADAHFKKVNSCNQ